MINPNAEVVLRPLTAANIDDLIAHNDSGSEFYTIPANYQEANRLLHIVDNNRRHNFGYHYNAYNPRDSFDLVGGGQILKRTEFSNIAWWVAYERRGQGYGKAIVAALEDTARQKFPGIESIDAAIDAANIASLALAASAGYEPTGATNANNQLIYRKILNRS